MIPIHAIQRIALLGMLAVSAISANANVTPNGIFTDHMVLQRNLPVTVFGTADPSEKVSVSFAGQKKSAVTDDDGKWSISLGAMKATKTPAVMTITGNNEVTLKNIVIGDVWVCSGQSNMEWSLGQTNRPDDVKAADFPLLRQFLVPKSPSASPREEVKSQWNVCSPQTAAGFTGVGFYFARMIHQETGIPIGLLHASWGGTLIEPWTSPDGLETIPEPMRAGASIPFAPSKPHELYYGMIHPLIRFPIRGVIWYQGESNALFDPNNTEDKYFHKQNALITGWRKAWNIGNFPFHIVQLANFENPDDNPASQDPWAIVRMAQLRALKIPNTGMAVAIDLADPGNPKDIHPKNKKDVGERLAAWSLAKDYGKKNQVHSGPLYKAMKVEGSKIRIGFEGVGSGLMIAKKNGLDPAAAEPQGKLKRFAIAGEDKKWVWADAVIDGKTVLVSSPAVAKPVAVRYAFSRNPDGCNLYNREGFPASPFRTDTW